MQSNRTVDKLRPLTALYENYFPAGDSGMLPLHAHADVYGWKFKVPKILNLRKSELKNFLYASQLLKLPS